jgi:hypothetical protein
MSIIKAPTMAMAIIIPATAGRKYVSTIDASFRGNVVGVELGVSTAVK